MAEAAVAAPPSFAPVEAKMKEAGLSDAAIAAFRLNFDALASGATGLVREERKGESKGSVVLPSWPAHWRPRTGWTELRRTMRHLERVADTLAPALVRSGASD